MEENDRGDGDADSTRYGIRRRHGRAPPQGRGRACGKKPSPPVDSQSFPYKVGVLMRVPLKKREELRLRSFGMAAP